MKRFFTAFCVLCLTAIFASAEEPELIERPLSWTIDSIQIVWNIEEKQTENYEWRSISDKSKSTSVNNTDLSRDTNTTTDTSEEHSSRDAETTENSGIVFSPSFLFNWGLKDSTSMSTRLGSKLEESTVNARQNEWVKSENTTYKTTESEDTSKGNQTLRYNRKLLFTVNFVNHSERTLLMAPDSANTIPIYCGNDHLGDARPIIAANEIFRIPATKHPYPCQFQMELNDSSKTKLLQSVPDIRILGSQIKIYNDEYDDAFTQSIQRFQHFSVRLMADGASREWEFRYNKKSSYTLREVLEAINEDCEAEDLFELDDDGTIISVAGFPVKPTRGSEVFVLYAWNGEPVTDLQDLKPRKNNILDVILLSRALLETRQRTPLTALAPFKETLEKWANEGLFDGKYLECNLLADENLSFAEIKKLAESGDPEMQYDLGIRYESGTGVEKDEKEAANWFRKSAEQGNAKAQNALGDCYKAGIGVEKDDKEAVNWFLKAAEQGNTKAQNSLGDCYKAGIGVEEDGREAASWFRMAAEQEYAPAQYSLANCYYGGIGVEEDEKEAASWYRKAAEQGYAPAQCDWGNCYRKGIGVDKDETEAVRWYRKAAEQGNAMAQALLGYCYASGVGVEKDERKAVTWFRKAAEQGIADAQAILGTRYLSGTGVEKDEKEAVRWFRKAAEQGDVASQFGLGTCYLYGTGIEKDEKKAVSYFRKAAEQGLAAAQIYLGLCYEKGKGVEKDEMEAVRCYRKAAEQGNDTAQIRLALCYATGIGVRKDTNEALRWLRKAASQGNSEAKELLREAGY